ncbi:MAG: response regulator transcription factor [Pirellulaceae bacterium]|nr:response regulator transcription factor [Pirellulaceae bacterium]
MSKLRVMLVDDHTVLRAGLRLIINSQADMEVVAEANNCSDAVTQAVAHQPDVMILDVTLPGGASLPIIGEIMERGVRTYVLMLTMHDDAAYVRAALAAGATSYVVKTIREQDLLQAIRDTSRGRMVVDLDDEELNASVFRSLLQPGTRRGYATRLSARESEVLRLLGQGFANSEIAEKLDLSPKTIATYRARLSEKLGLRTTADFVKFASDTGTF